MSKVPRATRIAWVSLDAMWVVAPSVRASTALAIEREIVVTDAPMAAAILTPM